MVYGIFSGEYSGWEVEGYFLNRKDAEKYCAVRNRKDGYSGFYVVKIKEIKANVEKVQLKYYHEVVFDFNKGMRKEPTRYEYFCGKDRPKRIIYNLSPTCNGWFSVSLMAQTRQKAEKIAQDIWTKFLSYYSETGDYNIAAKLIGANKYH